MRSNLLLRTKTRVFFGCLSALFLMSCSGSSEGSFKSSSDAAATTGPYNPTCANSSFYSLAPGDSLKIDDCLVAKDNTAVLYFMPTSNGYQLQILTGCTGDEHNSSSCTASAPWSPPAGQWYQGFSASTPGPFTSPNLTLRSSNDLVLNSNVAGTAAWQSDNIANASAITLQLFAGGYLAAVDAQWSTPLIPAPTKATHIPTLICAENIIPNNQILPGQYFPVNSVLMSENDTFGLLLPSNKSNCLLTQLSGCAKTTFYSGCLTSTGNYQCQNIEKLPYYNGNAACNNATTMGSNADHDFVVFQESYIKEGGSHLGASYVAYGPTLNTPAIVSVSDTDGSVVWNPVRWQSGTPALHFLHLGDECTSGQHQCIGNLPCAIDSQSSTGYSCGYAGTKCTSAPGYATLSDGTPRYYFTDELAYVCPSQIMWAFFGSFNSEVGSTNTLTDCLYSSSNKYLNSEHSWSSANDNTLNFATEPTVQSYRLGSGLYPFILDNNVASENHSRADILDVCQNL